MMLRSVTMPIKNFFLLLSLAPARSSLYLRPTYTTGMSLNCTTSDHRLTTGTSLNCTSWNSSGTTLNCTSLVLDPTPGTALNCNLRHLGHLGHLSNISDLNNLRHFSHLGHLGHLGNIGDLNTLDPYSHDPAPTDSLPGAFITEMDPTDPGPSEGCYADDLLDPLHTRTLETAYTSQVPLRDTYTSHAPSGEYHTRQTDALDGHGPTSGISIDALDGHGSFSEIEPQDRMLHK
jgi:hypothetical protein